MSGLGHILEEAGIATVVVGLVPQHVAAIRPPRALLVPFELGRPFGMPGDTALQRTVLDAALDLLQQTGPGPVVETLDVEVPAAAADDAWACPVSFPEPAGDSAVADRLLAEVRLLMPWFDRACKQRGHSAATVSGMSVEELCSWLCEFLEDPTPAESPVADRTLGETFKLGVEDLKAFYLEAVTAQPNSGGAADVNNWFWDETCAGEVLRTLREKLATHDDDIVKLHASFTLVPQAQVTRREAAG